MTTLSVAASVALLFGSTLTSVSQSLVPAPVGTAERGSLVLPAGSEVPLATLEELSSLTARQGQRFDLTVTEDVLARGYVVIPRGSRAVGEVRRVIGKGMVGKRGRIDMQLLFVEVSGHRIGIEGRTDDRGKSGAAPVVGTAVLAGAFGAFVTGTSARLPKGTHVSGYTRSDLQLSVSH